MLGSPVPGLLLFLFLVVRLIRSFGASLRDPEFRALFFLVGLTLLGGALFYRAVEHWTVLDSFYFSVVTLATVGYGDLAPKTPAGKVFTIFYIFLGISLLAGFAQKIASSAVELRRERRQSRRHPGSADDHMLAHSATEAAMSAATDAPIRAVADAAADVGAGTTPDGHQDEPGS
jgi:predicted nucleic acid-binding protein